jgi:hypothetical protein
MHPEKGLLSGTIIEIEPEENILWLKDDLGQKWQIDFSQAQLKGATSLAQNVKIRIIGQKLSENFFKAEEIRVSRGLHQRPGRRRQY